MARRLLIAGRGKFAIDCLKYIQRLAPDCALYVLAEIEPVALGNTLDRYCERSNIAYSQYRQLNTARNLKQASTFGADLGVSLNNFQIIKSPLLKSPREGFINFHNGPLPRYGGVNVCSWAIINGEKNYGVTWHFMDEGVDTGDIVAQRHFAIPAYSTALDLTMTCIDTGLEMLEQLAPLLAEGIIPRKQQPDGRRSYFSMRDVPNDGRIDFNWSSDRIERFVRGLSFQPMPNPFVYPQLRYAGSTFYVSRVSPQTESNGLQSAPGTIVKMSEEGIRVTCGDGKIILCELMDTEFNAIPLGRFITEHRMAVGDIFH